MTGTYGPVGHDISVSWHSGNFFRNIISTLSNSMLDSVVVNVQYIMCYAMEFYIKSFAAIVQGWEPNWKFRQFKILWITHTSQAHRALIRHSLQDLHELYYIK